MAAEAKMQFYLAENVDFRLEAALGGGSGSTYTITAFSRSNLGGKTPKVTSADWDPHGLREELCDKLTSVFQDRPLIWTMSLQRRCWWIQKVTFDTEFRIIINSDIDIGKGFKEILGEDVALQVYIFGVKDPSSVIGADYGPAKTIEMAIPSPQKGKIICYDLNRNESIEVMLDSLFRDFSKAATKPLCGKMNLMLISNTHGSIPSPCGPSEQDKMVIYKRILEEELAPDVEIVCKNEAVVKCNLSLLVAHSDVFQAMFAADMQEAKKRRIEMLDRSEEAVRAFLAYLYYWDQTKAEESCGMAVELLKFGHKYNIQSLVKVMSNLLILKPETWYEVDEAMKLYLFVKNLDEDWDLLKKKSVMVLKKNVSQLQNSSTFQQFFREDPPAAMNLFQYALSV